MVEWKKLGDVCKDVIVPMRDRPKFFDGTTPWCRIEDIEGMYFNKSLSGLMVSDSVIKKMNLKVFPTGTVICSCSATLGVCAINTQPLITNQTFIGLVCSDQVSNRYLYYYMLTRKKELLSLSTTGTIPYVSRDKFEKMIIPIPSMPEQKRIFGILDTFTSSIDNLKQQITQRRKQYEYYRDQLLDLEGKEGVEMKTLGETCIIKNGYTPSTKEPSFWENGTLPWFTLEDIRKNGRILKDAIKHITSLGVKRGGLFPKDSIIISTTATIGEYALIKSDFLCNQQITCLTIKEEMKGHLLPKYLYYLSDGIGKWCKSHVNGGGSLLIVSTSKLIGLQVPLPTLSEQQRIVSILDTFEASIQNLEAQLSQREKQYEYYRNKLLTFE